MMAKNSRPNSRHVTELLDAAIGRVGTQQSQVDAVSVLALSGSQACSACQR